MAALYLKCSTCHGRFRVEKVDPVTTQNNHFWCPGCGAPAAWGKDLDMDYWYTLAGAYNLPKTQEGVKLIREIYADWDPSEFQSFGKFMEALKAGN